MYRLLSMSKMSVKYSAFFKTNNGIPTQEINLLSHSNNYSKNDHLKNSAQKSVLPKNSIQQKYQTIFYKNRTCNIKNIFLLIPRFLARLQLFFPFLFFMTRNRDFGV